MPSTAAFIFASLSRSAWSCTTTNRLPWRPPPVGAYLAASRTAFNSSSRIWSGLNLRMLRRVVKVARVSFMGSSFRWGICRPE